MGGLSNYRAVGKYDVLEAPRNPIGAFDAEQFKKDALQLFENGSNHIVVDLGNLDYLYSDSFNAFSMIHQKLTSRTGSLGILASDDLAVKSLQQAGVDRYVRVFRREPELMSASLQQQAPSVSSILQSADVASGNSDVTASSAPDQNLRRTHKFTQSFNSTLNAEPEPVDLKGMPTAFDKLDSSKSGTSKVVVVVAGLLALAIGVVYWFFLR